MAEIGGHKDCDRSKYKKAVGNLVLQSCSKTATLRTVNVGTCQRVKTGGDPPNCASPFGFPLNPPKKEPSKVRNLGWQRRMFVCANMFFMRAAAMTTDPLSLPAMGYQPDASKGIPPLFNGDLGSVSSWHGQQARVSGPLHCSMVASLASR